MAKKFYLTNAIPYVNGSPHLGHSLEFIISDVITRYHRLSGDNTLATCGSDENGQKILEAAKKEGLKPQQLADKNTDVFLKHLTQLNVSFDVWRRATDKKLHWPGVNKLWQLCSKNGDIYKKTYQGLYCVGCEQFYTKNELVDGKCPEHDRKPETVSEENYFFKLSKYQKQLEELISSDKLQVLPQVRKNETLGFIRQGLQDFSVSRPAERLGNWGIPVPDDPNQVMYVWFDALTIYMTAIGWGYDDKLWQKWWPADIHVIGKGIYRFHTVYWPAMLLSAGLPLPKNILVHGYVNSGGKKMAKSLGNVVDPKTLLKKYGTDPIRYYLLKEVPTQADGDFTETRFKEIFNADLANGLGNLVSRVAKLAETDGLSGIKEYSKKITIADYIDRYEFNLALTKLWEEVRSLDLEISRFAPWEKSAADRKGRLVEYAKKILALAWQLQIFLPETAEKIAKVFTGNKIKLDNPLFPRL
ncbi:methionine--tRNA ligase [Patescibacteria group bacterium]|nr:methionine--tRNA ligase [Patescibacteria group bacterium]